MSCAQLQQDITTALALTVSDWNNGLAALVAAFANLLSTFNNMGNQGIALQVRATTTATAMANTAKISKLLTDPGPFDGSMAKFEEW